MTKETLIKSALRALVNGEVKQGSAGYALEEDSAYEVSWKDVLKWLEQQPSECTEHPCLDKLCRYYKQPCKDCISREGLLNSLEEPMNWTDSEVEIQEQRDYEGFVELVKSMPSVIPQIETCEDCISRQAVLDNAYAYGNGLEPEGYCVNVEDIQALPPVTPYTNLSETSQDVIDKIKEEILDEAEYAYADFDKYKEDILYAEPDELPDDDFRYGLRRAVEIINKYKIKSEDFHLPPLYQIGFQDGYMRAIYDNNKGVN